jgi:hypothetical protein
MCTMFRSEQLVTAVRKLGVKQVLSKSEGLGTNLVNAIEGLIHSKPYGRSMMVLT